MNSKTKEVEEAFIIPGRPGVWFKVSDTDFIGLIVVYCPETEGLELVSPDVLMPATPVARALSGL